MGGGESEGKSKHKPPIRRNSMNNIAFSPSTPTFSSTYLLKVWVLIWMFVSSTYASIQSILLPLNKNPDIFLGYSQLFCNIGFVNVNFINSWQMSHIYMHIFHTRLNVKGILISWKHIFWMVKRMCRSFTSTRTTTFYHYIGVGVIRFDLGIIIAK